MRASLVKARRYLLICIFAHDGPIPRLSILQEIVPESQIERVAEQMMADGLRHPDKLMDLDWIPIEYAYGQKLLKKLAPESKHPSMKELYARAIFVSNKLEEDLMKAGPDCSLIDLEPLTETFRDRAQRHRAQVRWTE